MKKFTVCMLFLFAIITNTYADDLCKPGGYVIGFFNGVWNTEAQAQVGLANLRDSLFGSTYNNEPLEYELFYNQTGSESGATMLQDLAEVFQQRALELDGALDNHWELFWEVLGSSSDEGSFIETLVAKIGRASSELRDLLSALYTDIITKSVAGWSYLLSNPPTINDYGAQQTRIKTLIIERKKLLLIAHSQGNLFMNHAYDIAMTITDANSVKAVHIAPASPTLRGNHILADLDLVINGLRSQGLSSIPPINVSIPASHLITDDFSGHQLVPTYLNSKRDTLPLVRSLAQAALDSLLVPETHGQQGFFTVTLTWDGSGDVDLHTYEPNGDHVYYASLQGGSGYLDYDNVNSYGPEHYYASCDSNSLVTGDYHIGINNYARATGRIATVQVATADDGEIFTTQLGVGSERGSSGDNSPIPVVTVNVSEDENGIYQVTVQ